MANPQQTHEKRRDQPPGKGPQGRSDPKKGRKEQPGGQRQKRGTTEEE